MPRILVRALSALLALGATIAGAPAALAAPWDPATSPVVIVGVGGLDWDDVDRRATPTLWRLVGGGAVGSLSARTSPQACPVEAWATVSAGRRVEVPVDLTLEDPCRALPDVTAAPGTGSVTIPGWAELVAALPAGTAAPGELGARVREAGSCATAVGPGAALALADRAGRVERYTGTVTGEALAACPVTVVDGGTLAVEPGRRQADLAAFDALLADLLELRPTGTRLVVAGLYETTPDARGLQAVVEYPTTVGWLTSESTRFPGVVTLSDLTATALAAVAVEATDLDGANLTVVADRRMTTERTVDNRRYLTEMSATIPVMLPVLLGGFGLAGLGAGVTLLRTARRPNGPGPATRRAVTATLVLAGSLPAGAYLAALSRWWVAPAPGVAAALTTVLAITAVALVTWAGARRLPAGPWRVAGALAAANWLVLTLDALTGTTLQQGSLLGQIPTLGTRFHGFGNVAFSVYAVSALVLAGTLATALRGRDRRVAVGVVGALGAVTVLVDGWPSLGADFGGVLALVPAFAVFLAHLGTARRSGRAILVVTGLTVASVTAVAVVDWARPGTSTHLGRFVQRVVDGEGLTVVLGKADQAIGTVLNPGGAVLAVLVVAGALALVGPWRPAAVRGVQATWPMLTAVCRAVVTAAAVGTVLNDSGILVGAGVLGLAAVILGAGAAEATWYGAGLGAPPTPALPGSTLPTPTPPTATLTGGSRVPVALVAVGGGVLSAMLLAAALVPEPGAGAVTRGGEAAVPPGAVVVVGTTGMTWAGITPAGTPTLWALVRDGAAVGGVTPAVTDASRRCAAAGWLALSAGRVTVAGQPGPGGWDCPEGAVRSLADGSAVATGWSALTALQERSEFRPRLGALGGALAEAGVCATAIGPGAALALAAPDGTVARYLELEAALTDPTAFACPVTVVDVAPGNPGVPTGTEVSSAERDRLQDLALRRVLAAVPDTSTVLVVDTGAASAARPALGVGVVTGGADPATGHLTATSTRWAGVVRLLDVPTTVLAAVAVPDPSDFSGSPVLATGARPALATTAVDRLAELTERDQALRGVAGTVTTGALLAGLLALGAAVFAGSGPARGRGVRLGAARAAVAAGVVLAAVPAGLFLMTTWQWWRISPRPGMWLALGLATAAVAGVLALVASRPARLTPVIASGLVAVLLTVDAVAGTPLHRGSPLGPAVTLGGRFYGFGNPTYAVYVVAAVVLAAGVATALLRRGRKAAAVAATATIGSVALVVDLWPSLGADVGGGLVLVPTFAVLVLAVAGVRVTLPRLALIGAAGVVAVGAIGYVDWLRPAAGRTHLGRFVQTVFDGTAGETVTRKAGYALSSLATGPMVWLATALLIALVLVLWRRIPWRAAWLERAETELPLLRPALWALVIAAVGGALVNDYGLRIVTLMAFALVPLLVLIVARTVPTGPGGGPLPCEGPSEESTP